VRWNQTQIARDLLQNFYDANRENLAAVAAVLDERDVRIVAPAGFDVERLFYLGSEKTSDDVGQHGEGFKAAATCLLRDYGVTPVGISGTVLVHVRLADALVSKTNLRPLVYDFYTISPPCPGAILLLPSCSPPLRASFSREWPTSSSSKIRCWGQDLGILGPPLRALSFTRR
jgi:hypothetical protein